MTIARNESRNLKVFERARADRTDVRKAKRFVNRMLAEVRRAPDRTPCTQKMLNKRRRIMFRLGGS